MLDPAQYEVNQTWIAFQVNDAPVITDRDGDFNMLALMDAASGFILAFGFVPTGAEDMSQPEVERLLKTAFDQKSEFAEELLVPDEQVADALIAAAQARGIRVARVPARSLQALLDEVRESFKEHISSGRLQ